MPAERFVQALNEQIGNEYAAHQQYVAIAVHYDALTLPRLAALFYEQAIEEREHAMMMVQYLLDADADVHIPGIDAPKSSFPDIVEPVRQALEQERAVTRQIEGLATMAREDGDWTSEQFLSWFLKEQVEEIAKMSSLLQVVERSKDNPMQAEDFVAREYSGGEAADPTAPPIAGG
jgi:bacterioferritin B